MKKRLFAALLAFAAVLSLVSCGGKVPTVKHSQCELWDAVPEGANTGFVEDYIYLWDLLENEYPALTTAERITQKDASRVKEKCYNLMPTVGDDPQMFYKYIINPCLAEFGGAGHLAAIDKEFYGYIYGLFSSFDAKTFEENSHVKSNFEAISTPEAKKFYAPALELMASAEEKDETEQLYNFEDNITIEYFSESHAGYVKIRQMNSYAEMDNPEFNALGEFFTKLENEGYENCIIDIRGNGGGDDFYWMLGLVYPNISQTLAYDVYALVKGEVSRQYIDDFAKPRGEKCESISKFPLEDFPKLTAEELSNYQYYYKLNSNVSCQEGKIALFTGKFWLLVDEGCYSSSESFAMFCKNTGFAALVGENTGGDGGGINPLIFCLPNSGICLRFSSMLTLNADGSGNEEFGTTPDYPIAKGADALQSCLGLIGENGKN